jgi:hypothetical protein
MRDKKPITIKAAKDIVVKVDKNMQASRRSNLLGFTRGNASKQEEPKGKAMSTDSNKSSNEPLKELTGVIKAIEGNHATQLKSRDANHASQLNSI